MNEKNTPFIAEIVNGILACIAVWFYRGEFLGLFIIFLLLWLVIFRKGILAIAGAVLISLAIELYTAGISGEFGMVLFLIFIGMVIDIAIFIGLPLLRGQPLGIPSITEAMFFAVIGVGIAYLIQILTCRIPVIQNGSIDATQIFSKMMSCHTQYVQAELSNITTLNSPDVWNNIALLCLRFAMIAPITWACIMVALRRVNFSPSSFGEFFGYAVRAYFGIAFAGIAPILIFAVIAIVKPDIVPEMNFSSFSFIGPFYFFYLVTDIFFASLGAAVATT